jgi:hypothetical protein
VMQSGNSRIGFARKRFEAGYGMKGSFNAGGELPRSMLN